MHILIKDAVKTYQNKRVIDISKLEFKNGKIYVILGFNGSGKSTLLNCIAGIDSLTSGSITYYNGQNVNNVKENLSIFLQKPYLFNISVYENIVSGLKFRKLSKNIIDDRVNKYINYFNFQDLLNKNAKKLSGGEAAKAALIRTAVLETDLTLLDEPTSSMDIESTISAEKLIMGMALGNRSAIVVTHDLYQAERIADYIIFMDKGKVIESGNKNKVLKEPDHQIVKMILNMQ
jgi:tungstate transport system ATP-binding protein